MFEDYVFEQSSAAWNNKLLVEDFSGIGTYTSCMEVFENHGFQIILYTDDLNFRVQSYSKLLDPEQKIVVLLKKNAYVPYDILRRLRKFQLSLENLFPKLNSDVLRGNSNLDLELLSEAYAKNYEDLQNRNRTEQFLRDKVYSADNVKEFIQKYYSALKINISGNSSYRDWMKIAEGKAKIDVLVCLYQINFDTTELNHLFEDYILKNFGKLSGEMNRETPILVSKAMDYMRNKSQKFAIIVMDGMSEFDWDVISESFNNINYERSAAFAMIPTITSISRQCLVANKYPRELIHPWKQDKEKQEFTECAKSMGFADRQIQYGRGYDFEADTFSKCCCVIINDCDDMVHGQKQGVPGMYQDMKLLSEKGELARLTKQLLGKGFDVYISADHGNTECIGDGLLKGTGVETETKSHRMIVLKDYADKAGLQAKYHLIEFPKYYLDKGLDYLICESGKSFDSNGAKVMSHGGITLDEVVVPFIEIMAVNNNG